MPVIKKTETIDGEEIAIYVEVEQLPAAVSPYEDLRSGDIASKAVEAVVDTFGDAMQLVRSCAVKAVAGIKSINEASRPDEFELKLAIKLDSEMGAVIAKVSAGAQLEVTMKWKSDKKP
ncbi:CU044_2847 family protein [Pseudanabaena minima]|uniref:CU044_2847 family protein n=1 Tax=Pseudanabaena minima TaxID=890415 RepID=UPI003DAA1703